MPIELVTRAGCHLCEQALAALRAAGVDPVLRDVDEDEELFRLYDFRVPVVLKDGVVVGEGRIDAGRLRRLLSRLSVERCGAEVAAEVHRLTREAFLAYDGGLDPPSGALKESLEDVRADLESHGGALARLAGAAAGCLRYDLQPGHLHVRRVAVAPAQQRSGVGRALMEWSEREACELGLMEVRVGVRVQLPGNRAFYERLGYAVIASHSHAGYDRPTWLEMSKKLGEGAMEQA